MRINEKNGDLICRYIDGSLDSKAMARFEKYLKKSSDLAERLDEMTASACICRDIPQAEPPADFAQRLHARLMSERDASESDKAGVSRSFGKRWAGFASAAAACLFVAVVLRFTIFNGVMPFSANSGVAGDTEGGMMMDEGKAAASPEERAANDQSKAGDMQIAAIDSNYFARRIDAQIKVTDVTESENDIRGYADSLSYQNNESTGFGTGTDSMRTAAVIEVKIPVAQFDGFLTWIKDNYSDIVVVSDSNTDMTGEMSSARDKLEQLESVIKEAESAKPQDVSKLDELKYQHQGIIDEINTLNGSVEYITLTIVLQAAKQ